MMTPTESDIDGLMVMSNYVNIECDICVCVAIGIARQCMAMVIGRERKLQSANASAPGRNVKTALLLMFQKLERPITPNKKPVPILPKCHSNV